MELPAEPAVPGEPRLEATRLPALARFWWLTAVRGLVALTLALAVVVAGRATDRLVTYLGLYWMAGGLLTLRFALAVRPRRGARLGLVAGLAAVLGRCWCCCATGSPGWSNRTCSSSSSASPPS